MRCRQLHFTSFAVVALAAVACSGDEDPSSTLGPLDSTAAASGATPGPSAASAAGSSAPAGPAGSGFVSIQVRLGSTGVEEVIALDRATVAADQLAPISLDARCTALDGGEGLDVSVTDLRRLSSGSRIVSARLHVDPPLDAAGTYDGSLEIGDGQQVVTTYTGSIVVEEGLSSGSFDVTDESGGVATGSFVCAAQRVATTTTVPASGGGEEIPGASTIVTAPPVSTLPPVIETLETLETLPPSTPPLATS